MADKSKAKKKRKHPPRPWKDIGLDLGLCVLSGVLWFCACSDIDIWPLAWIATVPLMYVIHDKRPGQAFRYGFLAGFVANYGGFYWITHTLSNYAHLHWSLGILGTSLLAAWQALVFALFSAAAVAILRRRPLGWTFVAPLVMVAAEVVVPMEFPYYLAITQAWVRPVIQIADIAGPLGVTFMLIMVSGAIFDLGLAWRRKRPLPLRRASIAGGLLVFTLVYGFVQMARYDKKIKAAPKLKIGVIQANLGIQLKGRFNFALSQLNLHHHLSLELQKRGADLIVWPEATMPFAINRDRPGHNDKAWFSRLARGGRPAYRHWKNKNWTPRPGRGVTTPMVVGVQTNHWGKGRKTADGRRPERIYNSVALIDSAGGVGPFYDKMFLVKFSEEIPFYNFLNRFSFFREQFANRTMSHFSAGEKPRSFKFGQYRLGPMICFEDILPSFGRKLAATEPNVFLNITNDAWFGATAEPYQHLALAVFRTIEHRRPMVRAVNTGTSTFIDATGRITVQTPSVAPDKKPAHIKDPTPFVAAAGMKKVKRGVWRGGSWPRPYILMESVAMMPHTVTIYAAVGWTFGYICLLLTLYLVFIHGRGLGAKLFRFRGEGMPMADRRGRVRRPEPSGDGPRKPSGSQPAAGGGGQKKARKKKKRKKR